MRDIKFRATIKETQEVFPVTTIWSDSVCLDTTDGDYEWNSWVKPKENVETMQYTGLSDKNGVEIYEGDILAIPMISEKEKYLFIIQWEKKTASFVLEEEDGGMTWYFDDLPYKTGVVIGNVYVHPHLLEVKYESRR